VAKVPLNDVEYLLEQAKEENIGGSEHYLEIDYDDPVPYEDPIPLEHYDYFYYGFSDD